MNMLNCFVCWSPTCSFFILINKGLTTSAIAGTNWNMLLLILVLINIASQNPVRYPGCELWTNPHSEQQRSICWEVYPGNFGDHWYAQSHLCYCLVVRMLSLRNENQQPTWASEPSFYKRIQLMTSDEAVGTFWNKWWFLNIGDHKNWLVYY